MLSPSDFDYDWRSDKNRYPALNTPQQPCEWRKRWYKFPSGDCYRLDPYYCYPTTTMYIDQERDGRWRIRMHCSDGVDHFVNISSRKTYSLTTAKEKAFYIRHKVSWLESAGVILDYGNSLIWDGDWIEQVE